METDGQLTDLAVHSGQTILLTVHTTKMFSQEVTLVLNITKSMIGTLERLLNDPRITVGRKTILPKEWLVHQQRCIPILSHLKKSGRLLPHSSPLIRDNILERGQYQSNIAMKFSPHLIIGRGQSPVVWLISHKARSMGVAGESSHDEHQR